MGGPLWPKNESDVQFFIIIISNRLVDLVNNNNSNKLLKKSLVITQVISINTIEHQNLVNINNNITKCLFQYLRINNNKILMNKRYNYLKVNKYIYNYIALTKRGVSMG